MNRITDIIEKHFGSDPELTIKVTKEILSLMPENPMEIKEFNDEWSDPKTDYDAGFQAGLSRAYEIARKELNK